MAAVARRRKGFGQAKDGIDWGLARRALAARRDPAEAGALLTVLVGDVVTATRASHWRGIGRGCPACWPAGLPLPGGPPVVGGDLAPGAPGGVAVGPLGGEGEVALAGPPPLTPPVGEGLGSGAQASDAPPAPPPPFPLLGLGAPASAAPLAPPPCVCRLVVLCCWVLLGSLPPPLVLPVGSVPLSLLPRPLLPPLLPLTGCWAGRPWPPCRPRFSPLLWVVGRVWWPWPAPRPPLPPGVAEETVEHVLWHCPRWADCRRSAVRRGRVFLPALLQRLSPLTLHSGLFPVHAELEEFARLACSHPVGLGALGPFHPGLHEFAWTDGGGLFAGTALAVASWAVCFGPQDPRSGSGQVAGAQTAQRGELQAACVAAHRRVGRLTIVTDSRYVSDGLVPSDLACCPPGRGARRLVGGPLDCGGWS